jgi:hypothetical protein
MQVEQHDEAVLGCATAADTDDTIPAVAGQNGSVKNPAPRLAAE